MQSFTRVVTVAGGKLYCDNSNRVMGPPGSKTRLFPTGPHTFFSKNADLLVTFQTSKDGHRMIFRYGGNPVVFKRVSQ